MDRTRGARPLKDGSVAEVRAAIAAVAPDLADEAIVMSPRIEGDPPPYWRGTARVGDRFMAKFAWSDAAAVGVARELEALTVLGELNPSLRVPEVVAASYDPLVFLTRYVSGVPAGEPYAEDTGSSELPSQVAEFLVRLHSPAVKERFERHAVSLGPARPQADTATLRDRFAGPIVTGARAHRVATWCDWIDDVQGRPVDGTTVVHGDLHTHNMVVSEDGEHLRLVVDLEEVAIADPAYDFRYLVSIRKTLDWFTTCLATYERASRRKLPLDRILAWHTRTALGDALWRTERAIPLPGALTPAAYVDDITHRLRTLAIPIP